MGIRAFERGGALRPEATILVVGERAAPAAFYLSTAVRQVFAVDGHAGVRPPQLPAMLVDPRHAAPYAFDEERVVAQRADDGVLWFPDAFFDGVLVIVPADQTQLGRLPALAAEIGRVLAPGGVASLSVPVRVRDGAGTSLPALDWQEIDAIVRNGGLAVNGSVHLDVTARTIDTAWSWPARQLLGERLAREGVGALDGRPLRDFYPQVALDDGGTIVTSIHLSLSRAASRTASTGSADN
jgi:SAM-dependent methyltransferase